jgi:hypothetical protein
VVPFIVVSGATARGHQIHRPAWQPKQVNSQEANTGRFRRRLFAAVFSSKPEVHCHTMAIKTVVLPRPSDTREPAPIVVEDSRWIIQVGKDRYAVDFHATARQVKQEPAKVVPIQSKLGSL